MPLIYYPKAGKVLNKDTFCNGCKDELCPCEGGHDCIHFGTCPHFKKKNVLPCVVCNKDFNACVEGWIKDPWFPWGVCDKCLEEVTPIQLLEAIYGK